MKTKVSENTVKEIYGIPYDELDKNIVGLVKLVNEFDGIYTIGSCGGHANNKPYQKPEGKWNVNFQVEFDETKVSSEGWFALEFLIWACNNLHRNGYRVGVLTYSFPPYINQPGTSMYFSLDGMGDDFELNEIVAKLKEVKEECFVSFEDYQEGFGEDFDGEFDTDEDE